MTHPYVIGTKRESVRYYSYATIQKETREQIKAIYPAAFANADYQTILYWIITQNVKTFIGEESRIAPYVFVAAMLAKDPTNFSALKELTKFEKDTGIRLNLSDYSYSNGKSREISPELDDRVIELMTQENSIQKKHKKDLVYFVGGDKHSPRKQSKKIKDSHDAYYANSSSIITDYFKELNPSIFISYSRNIDGLIEHVASSTSLSDNERNSYLAALQYLSDNPVPMYQDREPYKRIFTEGYSLQNIERSLRKGILKGTLEADLSSSQLTLAAYLWDVQSVKNLLSENVNIWKHIFTEMGIPFSAPLKAEIKNALYATIYGSGTDGIMQELVSFSPLERERFIHLDIIQDLRERQKIAAEKIERDKGAMSPQGVWIPKIGNPNKTLAQLMQSYERMIIEQVYIVANTYSKDFRIVSHEHDGVSIEILKHDRQDLIIRRLENAVREKGLELGIPMTLEIKE